MVLENLTANPDLVTGLVGKIAGLTTFLQAVGGFIIAYIVFNVINLFYIRRKQKEFTRMRELLESIDRKLGKKK